MSNKFKFLLAILLFVLQAEAQCDNYGGIVISEVYFDTHYNEDITSRYHSFGEYIELYNSSNRDINLKDWVIKDNHTLFKFEENNSNSDLHIKPGGYKIITYNGYYGSQSVLLAGSPSAIGGRAKFKELFPEIVNKPGFSENDIILQNSMVLYNDVDKVSLYNSAERLVDEVSYLNGSTSRVNMLEYMKISGFTLSISPRLDNFNGGVFNGEIGKVPALDSHGNPVMDGDNPLYIQHDEFKQAIFRSDPGTYYSNSGIAFQVATATPFSIPFQIALKDADPRLFSPVPELENSTELITYGINGDINGHSKMYYNDLGKPTVSLAKDFNTGIVWGKENEYNNFGRNLRESYPAPSCLEFDKVNFFSNSNAKADFLDKYYSDENTFEPYQATTPYPYTELNYDTLNPGNVISTAGGNKINNEWKSNYSFTVPAAQEMYYAFGYGYFQGEVDSNNNEEVIGKFYKTVKIDANGQENVTFTDQEGKVLATARSGNSLTYPVYSLIGTQGYIDVHIPKGITTISLLGGASLYTVFDLKTGLIVTTALSGGNAYRIVALAPVLNNPKVYVSNTSGILTTDTGAIGISYSVNYYDYTIYLYNKAGQLIKKIQPEGSDMGSPIIIKATPSYITSSGAFTSSLAYYSSGLVKEKRTSDEGTERYIYRKDGQLRYLQNDAIKDTKVSYKDYDSSGRPIETGTLHTSWATVSAASPDGNLISGTRYEQTFVIYDFPENAPLSDQLPIALSLSTLTGGNANYIQKNLSGNAAISYSKTGSTITSITWYSYDIYERIDWVVQYNEEIGIKTIHYNYDETGNLKKTIFQKDSPSELFVHRYSYDFNSKLEKVETSTDNITFITHADYSYYKTGALKRTNIAEGAQGIDYVYTLDGKLKSINHPSLKQADDPGGDMNDVFGVTLDYYKDDYIRSNTNIISSPTIQGSTQDFVGNIKAARWSTKQNSSPVGQTGYLYSYNKNNWLTNAAFKRVNTNSELIATPEFQEGDIIYDRNGNIKGLKRTDKDGTVMDNLTYLYSGNRLMRLNDTQVTPQTYDIEGTSNYTYNNIGQITDNTAGALTYDYNERGLIRTLVTNGNKVLARFYYNERGQRTRKETYNTSTFSLQTTDYYIRDLDGNALAIYTKPVGGSIVQKELSIYGLDRLGVMYSRNTAYYQITDHLGNVRSVIKKITGNPIVQIMSFSDYYPFGEQLVGRNSTVGYRYGYQGQELDNETGMEAFELRLWDGRIGRWLVPDPYGQFDSPYVGMGNNPVNAVDPNGGYCYGLDGREIPCPDNYSDGNKGPTDEGLWLGGWLDDAIVVQNYRDDWSYGAESGHAWFEGVIQNNQFESGIFNGSSNISFIEAHLYGLLDGKYAIDKVGLEAHFFKEEFTLGANLDENNGVTGKASYEFLSVNATGSGGVYAGTQGKYGARAKLEAGVYVLKGDLEGTVRLFGVEGSWSAGLDVGAHAGMEGGVYYDENNKTLNINAGENLGWIFGESFSGNLIIPITVLRF